jgi:hypothetical protein
MTRSLPAVPSFVLVVALVAGPAAASSGSADLPRLVLESHGPLLAKKKKKAEAAEEKPAEAAAEDVLEGADAAKPASDGEELHTALPDSEVKVGGTVVGQSVGGATGFVFKQGIYTQSDLGGFFVFGAAVPGVSTGYTITQDVCPKGGTGIPCKPVLWSQLQPYIGLSVGYDILQWLGVQVSFGTGFVANAAIYDREDENPRDYGITTVNAAVVGSFYVLERLALMGKLFGGAAFVSPEPEPDAPTLGGNAGLGIGVRYATLLPDVFVGLDGNAMITFLPDAEGAMVVIPGISFAPVIKYVF